MGKKNDSSSEAGIGNKILSVIITILIVIILLGVLVACVKLDVGGVGNNVFRPIIKDVPVLKKILPQATDEQMVKENNYTYDNIADAVERIKELELKTDELNSQNEELSTQISDYISEINRLKAFEEQQETYEKNLKEFNENIVFNNNAPDIEEYKSYYEEIDPENAQEIYRQVIEQLQADEEIQSLASTYAKMEPKNAAQALESNKDLSLVCEILTNMSEKAMAGIMDQMSAEYAATITSKIKSQTGAN